MAQKKTYEKSDIVKAADKILNGAGQRKTSKETGLTDEDAAYLQRISGMQMAEYQAELQKIMKSAMVKMAKRLENNVDNLPLTALGINFGILHDKMGASGAPTIQNQTNIQINGNVGREDVIGLLTGAKGATKQQSSYPEPQPVEVVAAEGPLPTPTGIGENSPLAPIPPSDPAELEANPDQI